MLWNMTEEQIKKSNERLQFLRTSPYVLDNLTGYLMDSGNGGTGLYENVAREKANSIIGYFEVIVKLTIPDKRPSDGLLQAALKEREGCGFCGGPERHDACPPGQERRL